MYNALGSSPKLYFPLERYGFKLERILNNKDRWDIKIVCCILDRNYRRCVSTTYAEEDDYFKLVESTTLLNCNSKSSPKITGIYPKHNTIVCDFIGEFLCDYLLDNPGDIFFTLTSVSDYLRDINSIQPSCRELIIPSIIKESMHLAEGLPEDFEFLPRIRAVLPELERSNIKFAYGYGIEDPHIWNFRIVKNLIGIGALTTDFDYFSDSMNYFWELGYFYATFRWFKKASSSLAAYAEEILLSLIQDPDLKSEFMFWLGVLSSYCGYRDSLRNMFINDTVSGLNEQYSLIQELDEKTSYLADELLKESLVKEERLF